MAEEVVHTPVLCAKCHRSTLGWEASPGAWSAHCPPGEGCNPAGEDTVEVEGKPKKKKPVT